jgi:hypothetical protein
VYSPIKGASVPLFRITLASSGVNFLYVMVLGFGVIEFCELQESISIKEKRSGSKINFEK